jgi:Skp family chaperone for outer membrane proteins
MRRDGLAVLGLAIIAGLCVYQTQAVRPAAAAEPTVVAYVNLETIFQNLAERSQADVSLLALAETLDGDGQARRDALELLKQDLELYAPGSKQHEDTTMKLAEMGYQLQAYREFALRKLEVEKASVLRALYDKIKESVRMLSEQNGYDVVMVDDSVVPVPEDLTEKETWRQISARRTLYASPQIDITDDVLAFMNNQFNAMQGG